MGIAVGEQVFALDQHSFPDMSKLLSAGASALGQAKSVERGNTKPASTHRSGDVTLLAPIPKPSKIIAVGLNYRDHAIETKLEISPNAHHLRQVSFEHRGTRCPGCLT